MHKKYVFFIFIFSLISCGGGGGGGSSDSAPTPTLATSISASSTSVEQGDNFSISWSSSNASSCTASGSWEGSKATSGTETFSSADVSLGDYSFSITCNGAGTSLSRSVTVSVIEPVHNISGTVFTSYGAVLDTDVPSSRFSSFDNNTQATAQAISLPSQIIGHVSLTEDEWDVYSVYSERYQYVLLEIIDYDSENPTENDLDLFITDANLNIVADSESTDNYELLLLPDEGEYLIAVKAYAGDSKYALSIGTQISKAFSLRTHSSNFSFSDELLIQKKNTFNKDNKFQNLIINEFELGQLDPEGISKKEFKPNLLPKRFKSKLSNVLGIRAFGLELTRKNLNRVNEISKNKELAILNSLTPDLKILPNIHATAHAFTRDPEYYRQWNQISIGLDDALGSINNTNEVIVAVVDSGSPEVGSRAWNDINFTNDGYDFLTEVIYNGVVVLSGEGGDGDGIDSNPYDFRDLDFQSLTSHGTHVASTIAAKNNRRGINGMNVKVMPVRVLPNHPFAGGFNGIIQGIRYAAGLSNDSGTLPDKHADVINLSLGGASSDYCSFLQPIIDKGVVLVAAAGNESSPMNFYPASCSGVISVGAHDINYDHAYYSNYNQNVDISAPGGDINWDLDGNGITDGVYAYTDEISLGPLQGTSMAAPHVSGAIAVMKSINSAISNTDIDAMIADGSITIDRGLAGRDDYFGHGTLDLAKAVNAALNFTNASSNTFASLSNSTADYGVDTESITVALNKYGDESLSVVGLFADNNQGFTYGSDVNEEGFGEYTFFLDRSEFNEGRYSNVIYFQMSSGAYVRLLVYFAVGSDLVRASVEAAFLILYGGDGEVIRSQIINLSDGEYDFSFENIPTGEYSLRVTTDIDEDEVGCTRGELCGFYPFDTSFGSLSINDDLTISKINLNPVSFVNVSSLKKK